jgi:hypothetical protein
MFEEDLRPRNAELIAFEIIRNTPEDKVEFLEELNYLIKNDFVYKDDLALRDRGSWQKLQRIMHKHIPLPDEDWKEKIINVFIGKI